jgi:hypothetical protein
MPTHSTDLCLTRARNTLLASGRSNDRLDGARSLIDWAHRSERLYAAALHQNL